MRGAACLLAAALMAPAAAGAEALPAWAAGTPTATVLVDEPAGNVEPMSVAWFLPPGLGPFPVVVFSHGRDATAAGRAALALGVSRAQVQYWLARDIAVVSAVRPGYGAQAGADVEDAGVRFDRPGHCAGHAEFRRTAEAAARAVEATLQWLVRQPWADAGDVLLVGQSVGGLATVAAASRAPSGVAGYVNFAGGTGGDAERSPGRSCDPAQVAALYADYGRSTTLPNLWLYAQNDPLWGADAPRDWHAAFARGGSPTTFVQAAALADDHGLARHAPAPWAPAVDAFLARLGFPWDLAIAPRPVLRLDAGGL